MYCNQKSLKILNVTKIKIIDKAEIVAVAAPNNFEFDLTTLNTEEVLLNRFVALFKRIFLILSACC
jgi:hypothetical protein